MTPSERRTACIRLLAEIDRDIAEADSLARNELLTPEERKSADLSREFYRWAACHTERILAAQNQQ
jgi:hypothetical protein